MIPNTGIFGLVAVEINPTITDNDYYNEQNLLNDVRYIHAQRSTFGPDYDK